MPQLLYLRDELAGVGTLKELHPSRRHTLEASLDNVLALLVDLEFTILQSLLEQLDRFRIICHVIEDNEASDLDTHGDDFEPILQTCSLIRGAVIGA